MSIGGVTTATKQYSEEEFESIRQMAIQRHLPEGRQAQKESAVALWVYAQRIAD